MKTSRTVVGVDTAKRVFQLHWVDMETGEIVDLKLTRAKFLEHFANRVPCVVAMEACGGSKTQHWARQLREIGHDPWLLPRKGGSALCGRQQERRARRAGDLDGGADAGRPDGCGEERGAAGDRAWRCTVCASSW